MHYNLLNSYNMANWLASTPGRGPKMEMQLDGAVVVARLPNNSYHLLHFYGNFKEVIVALRHCLGADPIFPPNVTIRYKGEIRSKSKRKVE